MIEEGKVKEAREMAAQREQELLEQCKSDDKPVEPAAKIPKIKQEKKTVSIANISIKSSDLTKVILKIISDDLTIEMSYNIIQKCKTFSRRYLTSLKDGFKRELWSK